MSSNEYELIETKIIEKCNSLNLDTKLGEYIGSLIDNNYPYFYTSNDTGYCVLKFENTIYTLGFDTKICRENYDFRKGNCWLSKSPDIETGNHLIVNYGCDEISTERIPVDLFILDLDNTLAIPTKERLSYLEGAVKEWPKFFNLIPTDTLNIKLWNEIKDRAFYSEAYEILILTGRREMHSKATIEWLEKNNIKYDNIIFRDNKDFRKAAEFKSEIIKKYRWSKDENPVNKVIVYDDDESVIEAVKELFDEDKDRYGKYYSELETNLINW